MKIEIDVAALFAKLDLKYKFITFDKSGVYAYEQRPKLGVEEFYVSMGDAAHLVRSVTPQLFERPVPSAWKDIKDCNLDGTTVVLVKRDVNDIAACATVYWARANAPYWIWCEIPK